MPQETVQPARDDPSEALMREVGAQLREVRRERGEDLDEIAEYLRIRPVYLHGIERGDMSVMPGRTYALGFLRTYADYLGFDGEDLIEQIKSTVDDLTGKTRFHMRAPLHESRLPKMPLLVLSVAMLAGIYAGWTWLNRDDGARFEQLPPLEEELPPGPEEQSQAPDGAGGASGSESRSQAANEDDAPARPSTAENDAQPADDLDEATVTPSPEDEGEDEGLAGEPAGGQDGDPTGSLAEVAPEAGPAAESGRPSPGDPTDVPGTRDEAQAGSAAPASEPGAASSEVDEVGELIAEVEEAGEALQDDPRPPDAPGQTRGTLEPAAADPRSPDVPPEAAAAVETVLAAAEENGGTVHEPGNVDSRVILRAMGQSWMQITSTSGDYLRTRTLEAGDSFFVPNRDDLVLWTGNAGAIEFLVDGERIAPLGPEGTVIRDIPLEPSALLARAARPE